MKKIVDMKDSEVSLDSLIIDGQTQGIFGIKTVCDYGTAYSNTIIDILLPSIEVSRENRSISYSVLRFCDASCSGNERMDSFTLTADNVATVQLVDTTDASLVISNTRYVFDTILEAYQWFDKEYKLCVK